MTSALQQIRKRVHFEADEPGVLLLLLIAGVFLLFSPGGACSYDAAADASPQVAGAHDHGDSH